jgi:glycogen synthase
MAKDQQGQEQKALDKVLAAIDELMEKIRAVSLTNDADKKRRTRILNVLEAHKNSLKAECLEGTPQSDYYQYEFGQPY